MKEEYGHPLGQGRFSWMDEESPRIQMTFCILKPARRSRMISVLFDVTDADGNTKIGGTKRFWNSRLAWILLGCLVDGALQENSRAKANDTVKTLIRECSVLSESVAEQSRLVLKEIDGLDWKFDRIPQDEEMSIDEVNALVMEQGYENQIVTVMERGKEMENVPREDPSGPDVEWSNRAQQARHPGDLFFEHMSSVEEKLKHLNWPPREGSESSIAKIWKMMKWW